MRNLAFLMLAAALVLGMSALAYGQDQDDDTAADDDAADDDAADDDAADDDAADDDAADDDAADDDAADDDAADDDAADDDAAEFAGTVVFTSPEAPLAAQQEYDFDFKVDNTSTTTNNPDNWICQVELFMPSAGYSLGDVSDPEEIHDGQWTNVVDYDADNRAYIHWQHSGATSSGSCDIKEGEALEFSFKAATDENATDGFEWKLVSFANEFATGTYMFGGDDDDDDDDDDTETDDDAMDEDDDDDDDNDSGGCGC